MLFRRPLCNLFQQCFIRFNYLYVPTHATISTLLTLFQVSRFSDRTVTLVVCNLLVVIEHLNRYQSEEN